MLKKLSDELYQANQRIRYLNSLVKKLEKELDKTLWKEISKVGNPKCAGEYECTVVTKKYFKGMQEGVKLNVRLIFVNNTWKNQYFELIPYYDVIAWKEISEPFGLDKDE